MNYPRRQQYRRLSRAGGSAAGARSLRCSGSPSPARDRGRSPGCCSSSPSDSGSTLAAGSDSLAVAESALVLRTRSSARSQRCRWRAGGFGTRCRGTAGETSTPWRSRQPESRSRSRQRPGRTTSAISLGCASRWPGCHGAGEDGRAAARLESCVSSVRVVSSALSMTLSWSRSTG